MAEYWRAERRMWRSIAFCAYFGNQPISEVRALTTRELRMFHSELAELVKNAPTIRFG